MTQPPNRAQDARTEATPDWMRQQERGNLFWLRVMRALSLTLGRRLTRPILYGIALYFVLTAHAARRASRDYLSHIQGSSASWWQIYTHVLAFASTIHDRIFLLNDCFDVFDFQVSGVEELHALHRAQGGVFLFGGHIGSFEALRTTSRHTPDVPQHIFLAMYEENARRISSILGAINPANAPEIIPLGKLDSMLKIREHLEQGAFVGILADRSLAIDQCVSVPFMGRTAQLPTGPFRMAAMLRRPVVCMAGLYRGGNRYDVHFKQIADFSHVDAAGRHAAIAEAMENYARTLESYCRAAPLNWFNFYDFWNTSAHAQN